MARPGGEHSAVRLSLPIFIVLHEASHAISAKILRLQVPRITIGFGRHIARFHIGETVVTVGMLPLGGLTYMVARSLRLRRLRGWLATAAGPATNALICIALLPLLERSPSGWPAQQLAQQVGALQVVDDELLWALHEGIAGALDLPMGVHVVGEPLSLVGVDYDGNARRGLTARST